MAPQEYPKCLYRGDSEHTECKVVRDGQEHEAAKLDGWGPHPSTVKIPELPTSELLTKSRRPAKKTYPFLGR